MSKKIITDEAKIEEILSRGVHEVYNRDELKQKLLSGKQLNIKLGVDVTGPDLHLGHSVIQRKLRDFQELGHKVTFIIGDFTTLVGDHSDKVDMRAETTPEIIKKNEKHFTKQFFKTVKKEGTKVAHNSTWLKKLSFADVIRLTKLFTVSQMLDRETFLIRYKENKPIGLDEFLYPIMQGYDSVAIKADLELGATDQTFNVLAGRKLTEALLGKPQSAMTMRLLTGSDGRPMGKSLKNFIPISATPEDMYGKVMTIIDPLIPEYFELVTRVPLSEIARIKKAIGNGESPYEYKRQLAKEIVTLFHGEQSAKKAEAHFESVFSKGILPEDMPEIIVSKGVLLADTLVEHKILSSKGEFRRIVLGNGLHDLTSDTRVTDVNSVVNKSIQIKIGKHRFVSIKVK